MKTILVVEDSRTMMMCLKQSLELSNYKVVTAENGQIAMDHLTKGLRPDVVITDINMPVMNGLEFIQRARPILRFTPILALTTESQQSKRDEARKLGATGWMVKPISSPNLLQVIERVMHKASASA